MTFYHVNIFYGPMESFHTFAHRPQKLRGLRLSLQKLGYRVDLVPVDMIDMCEIVLCGFEIFRCNIKNLAFNLPESEDPVCQRAVAAVLDASQKMNRARTFLWTWTCIGNELLAREKYGPKNYWNVDVDLEPLSTTCADCCHIFFTGPVDTVERKLEAVKNDK